jgi:hypothetical protein
MVTVVDVKRVDCSECVLSAISEPVARCGARLVRYICSCCKLTGSPEPVSIAVYRGSALLGRKFQKNMIDYRAIRGAAARAPYTAPCNSRKSLLVELRHEQVTSQSQGEPFQSHAPRQAQTLYTISLASTVKVSLLEGCKLLAPKRSTTSHMPL